jgi:hypothetical protein
MLEVSVHGQLTQQDLWQGSTSWQEHMVAENLIVGKQKNKEEDETQGPTIPFKNMSPSDLKISH